MNWPCDQVIHDGYTRSYTSYTTLSHRSICWVFFSCIVIVLVLYFCLNITRTKLLLLRRNAICLLKNCCMCISLSVHVCPVVTVCPPQCLPPSSGHVPAAPQCGQEKTLQCRCVSHTNTSHCDIWTRNWKLKLLPAVSAAGCRDVSAAGCRCNASTAHIPVPVYTAVVAGCSLTSGVFQSVYWMTQLRSACRSSAISDTWRESVQLCCCTLTHSRGGNTRMGRCTL